MFVNKSNKQKNKINLKFFKKTKNQTRSRVSQKSLNILPRSKRPSIFEKKNYLKLFLSPLEKFAQQKILFQ